MATRPKDILVWTKVANWHKIKMLKTKKKKTVSFWTSVGICRTIYFWRRIPIIKTHPGFRFCLEIEILWSAGRSTHSCLKIQAEALLPTVPVSHLTSPCFRCAHLPCWHNKHWYQRRGVGWRVSEKITEVLNFCRDKVEDETCERWEHTEQFEFIIHTLKYQDESANRWQILPPVPRLPPTWIVIYII